MAQKINNCLSCGGDDIEISDCGYSSFNCGSVKCRGCGKKFKTGLGCNDDDNRKSLIKLWNSNNPTKKQQLKLLEKEIPELQKQLSDKKRQLKKLKKIVG